MNEELYSFFVENKEYASIVNEQQKEIYQTEFFPNWLGIFLYRIRNNELSLPISIDDFLSQEDVIIFLKVYDIDPVKIWVAFNFIYDIMIDKTTNVRIRGNTLKTFKEVREFIHKHPNFNIYISDDSKVRVKQRCEISNPSFRLIFTKMVDAYIADYQPDDILDSMAQYYDNDSPWFRANNSETDLGLTYKIYYMYLLIENLLSKLITHNKRRPPRTFITYDRRVFIARIIYLFKVTADTEYLLSADGLNGVISQHRGSDKHLNIRSRIYYLLI